MASESSASVLRIRGSDTRLEAVLLGFLTILLVLAGAVRAEINLTSSAVAPGKATGYSPQDTFVRLDGADINAFNLNYIVSFPIEIGFSYPQNAGLSLSLSLTYNSRAWVEHRSDCHQRTMVRIRRQNPFGLGFDLHLGRIVFVPKYRGCFDPTLPGDGEGELAYVSPSGTRNFLVYQSTEPEGVLYRTFDGSFLKAYHHAAGWTIYFPSGEFHEFRHEVAGPPLPDLRDPTLECCVSVPGGEGEHRQWECPEGNAARFIPDDPAWSGFDRDFVGWHLTRATSVRDTRPAPASYTVTYYGDDNEAVDDPEEPFRHIIKRIEDQHGRRILFNVDMTAGPRRGQVESIDVPAPPDPATSAARTATYAFDYADKPLWIHATTTEPANHGVKVLTAVSGPVLDDGRRYVHSFTYTDSNQFPAVVPGLPYYGGQLRDMTLPSGRLRRLSYQGYTHMSKRDFPEPFGNDQIDRFYGVSEIEEFLDGDSENIDPSNRHRTSFSHQNIEHCAPPGGLCEDFDQQNTMVDKAENRTVMLFDTPYVDYGVNPAYGRIVSESYFGGADLKKQVEYQYEVAQESTCSRDSFSVQSLVTTTFVDDSLEVGGALPSPTRVIVASSEFDDFGNPQRVETFGSAIGDERLLTITDYASDNESGESACFPAIRGANISGVVLREEVRSKVGAAETIVERTDYTIDSATGQRLAAIQRIAPAAGSERCSATETPSTGDVVTEYLYTNAGDVRQESRFIQGGTGDAGTTFTWDYTYDYGTLATSKNAGLGYFDVARTIDPATGLVIAEQTAPTTPGDPNAVTSRTGYDILGRPISLQVGDDLPTTTSFVHDPLIEIAARLREVREVRGSGDQQTVAAYQYQFGRLVRADVVRPDGTWAFRHTRYDDAGRIEFVSEWTAEAALVTALGTTTDYTFLDSLGASYEDPSGRPSRTTDALGNTTRFEYFGLNKAVTVEGVSGGDAVERILNPKTVYYEDGLGRLRVVDSPKDGSTVEGADAQYTYDIRGALREVRLAADVTMSPTATDRYASSAGAAPQLRSFQHDALGRQTSATHPESGTTTTLSWNALGSPIDVQDAKGAAWHHRTRTDYDLAGRPLSVMRVLDPGETAFASVHEPVASGWVANGWATTDSPSCLQRTAWYHGAASCNYATTAAQTATLESPMINAVPVGATLSFEYYREVRSADGVGGDLDRFSVEVSTFQTCTAQGNPFEPCQLDPEGHCVEEPPPQDPCTPGWASWFPVFVLDSSQVSFGRWMRSPAIRLPVSGTLKLRFTFDSVDQNPNATLKGIGIGQVVVRDPAEVALVEMAYDEDFGITGNRARGKLTTVRSFSEATLDADSIRKFEFASPEGTLTGERFFFDWDGNGSHTEFRANYHHDELGQLTARSLPHPPSEAARIYEYGYRHGQPVRLESVLNGTRQKLIDDQGSAAPGITYNVAGLPEEYRFANGNLQRFSYNAAGLPHQITGERPGQPTLLDTGVYGYDGAGNINAIGSDIYRYDTAGRLTWSRVTGETHGALDIDNRHDVFGNMTDQLTAPMGQQPGTGVGPAGLHFSGRTYAGNKMNQDPFAFDQNGNLVHERPHDGVGGYNQVFTPENRIAYVQDADGATRGRFRLEASYDGGGHRWLRRLWSEGGKALVSFRDATGKVTADFEEASASGGLKHVKDYVHVGSQLVAINSFCGPRPDLTLDSPAQQNGNLRLFRTDYVPSQDGFKVLIRGASGQQKVLSEPASLATHFTIPLSELYPGEDNLISIQTDASCGTTGYSNAVSYTYYPPQSPPNPPTCIGSMGISRSGFTGGTSTSLTLSATTTCTQGTRFNVYFLRETGGATIKLNGGTLPVSQLTLPNQPAGTGFGSYWFAPVNPGTGIEGAAGPGSTFAIQNEDPDTSSGGSGGGTTTPPAVNAQFVHWDHLGSTRAISDEHGVLVAAYKYYPFGMLADVSGGKDNRMMFTGHERDSALGLDYMLARYYSPSLARFLSTDPGDDTYLDAPQSWNKYPYVRNNPINATDPNGQWVETAFDVSMAGVSIKQAWDNPSFANIAGAVLDVAAVAIPIVPAVGGRAIDAAQLADKAVDAAKGLKATERGLANEAKVLAEKGLAKNTEKVVGAEGKAIPDALTKTDLVEVKDAARVTDSKQLRIESQAAQGSGRQSTLVTGEKTKVSPKAEARFDKVERREDLGPQE